MTTDHTSGTSGPIDPDVEYAQQLQQAIAEQVPGATAGTVVLAMLCEAHEHRVRDDRRWLPILAAAEVLALDWRRTIAAMSN